jgi:hypothetical protein
MTLCENIPNFSSSESKLGMNQAADEASLVKDLATSEDNSLRTSRLANMRAI